MAMQNISNIQTIAWLIWLWKQVFTFILGTCNEKKATTEKRKSKENTKINTQKYFVPHTNTKMCTKNYR